MKNLMLIHYKIKEIKLIPITFKMNSWHVWLVSHFSPYKPKYANDLCQYIRWVLLSIFLFATVAVLSFSVVSGVVFDILSLFGRVHWHHNAPGSYFELCAGVTNIVGSVIIALMTIIYAAGIVDKISRRSRNKVYVLKEPGFVKIAYRSFKDKVCFKVNFE